MPRIRRVKIKKEPGKNIEYSNKDKDKSEQVKKILDINKVYNRIKYKNEIISVGDKFIIEDTYGGNFIAKLIEIIPFGGIEKYSYWPSIKVQIYYSKYDINRISNGLDTEDSYNSISEFELFKSNKTEICFVENIKCKCDIYSLDEYEKLENLSHSIFFTRADYNTDTEIFNPPFDKWTKTCVCQKPLNPDQLYIKCDKCEKWFHPEHCGLNQSDADKIDKFFCPECKGENK